MSAGQDGLQSTEHVGVREYIGDERRPCPSRSSRVSSPLLLFTAHSAGHPPLQRFDADQEILLCQNEDHILTQPTCPPIPLFLTHQGTPPGGQSSRPQRLI